MRTIDTLAHEYGWSDQSILDLSVAKARAYLDAASARRKSEFRRTVALQEWSTQLIASITAATAGQGAEKMQKEIAKAHFPWEEDQKKVEPATEGDDLSFIETGDLSAADKNKGKQMPSKM